jgi:hypothetical protein
MVPSWLVGCIVTGQCSRLTESRSVIGKVTRECSIMPMPLGKNGSIWRIQYRLCMVIESSYMQIGLGGMAAVVAVVSVCQSSRSMSWSHNFENVVGQLTR